jgi:uncharacterized protein with HEPN domain
MSAKPVAVDERLRDVVKWGEALARHIAGMALDDFLADEKTHHAALKCIEAIGEAAKEILKAEPTFDLRHPDLKLKAAARMRDRLSHSYRDIDLGVVWATATTSVPRTVAAAATILAQLNPPTAR